MKTKHRREEPRSDHSGGEDEEYVPYQPLKERRKKEVGFSYDVILRNG